VGFARYLTHGGEGSQPVTQGRHIPGAGKPEMGRRLCRPRPRSPVVVLLAVLTALAVQPAPASASPPGPSASLTVFYRSCYRPQSSRLGFAGGGCAAGLVMRVNRCRNGATDLFVSTDDQGNLKRYACRTGTSHVVTRNGVSLQVIPVRMKRHLIVARGRAITYESANTNSG
jgi:hypothetical protein